MADQEIKDIEPGLRLDQNLARHFPDVSRAYCQDLVSRGFVRVSGQPRSSDYRLLKGDVITIRWPECAWKDLPFEKWIIFEDPSLLIVNKPSGLLVHPIGGSWLSRPEAAATEEDANLAGLLFLNRPKAMKTGVERCGIVHRLDRGTSGLMVVSKTPEAQEALGNAFEGREIEKTYRAIVQGAMDESVDVDAPVGRKAGGRKISVSQWGREAATRIRVLKTAKNASMIEAKPLTGRTHQIRAHLAHVDHPVLGDPESHTDDPVRLQKLDLPVPPRLMLHAYRLQFKHPKTHRLVRFTALPPKDFKDYWQSIS